MDITKKSEANHRNEDFSIYSMILNRLPIIADNDANKTLISNFILEIMNRLEPCLEKGNDKLAIEQHYTFIEQSLIADLTSIQILMVSAIEATGGNATEGTDALNTFLKKAKAGSIEVEFGPFSLKDNPTLAISAESMFKFFKNNAINKANQLGCYLDITDDFSINFLMDSHIKNPFIVVENGTSY